MYFFQVMIYYRGIRKSHNMKGTKKGAGQGKVKAVSSKRSPGNEETERHRAEIAGLSRDAIEILLEDLWIRQTELELQNQQLRQMQETIEESRRQYTDLYDYAPVGYFTLDANGVILKANLRAASMLDTEMGLLIGKPFAHHVVPDDRNTFYLHCGNVLQTGKKQTCELRIMKRDGNVLYGLMKSILMSTKTPEAGHLWSNLTDITAQKSMEEAVKYQSLLLSTQQEVSIDGILVVDDQGAVLSYNRRFVEIWGIPPEVLKTMADEQFLQAVMDRLAKPDEFLRKVKYLYAHKQETSRDDVALADGRVLDRYSAAVVGDEGKYYGRVWYFRDITEQKQILNALEQRERELMVKSKTLEEVNIALKVLLEQREKDKNEEEDKILFNVRKLILPYIDSLRQRRLDNEQATYLDIIETNLKNIISPFAKKLSSIQESFTPLEIRVADFIREGKTAKEIARTFGVSESAINLHRQHIRNKLGLNNKKINLRTYLLTLINK